MPALDPQTVARLLEFALVLVALEGIALVAYHAMTGKGLPWGDVLPNLLSGALLMAAGRAILTGNAASVPLWLGGALVAHLLDLRNRLRG